MEGIRSLLYTFILQLSKRCQIPALTTFLPTIFYLNINERKILLKATRMQPPVSYTSRFYVLHPDLQSTIRLHHLHGNRSTIPGNIITLYDFFAHFHPFFSSPISAGFTSTMLRQLPYSSYVEVAMVRRNTMMKEIEAAVSAFPHPTFNYEWLFGVKGMYRPLAAGLPCRPEILHDVKNRLDASFSTLQQRILIPDFSSKSCMVGGSLTESPIHLVPYERFNNGFPICSTKDLEMVYSQTGIMFEGLTEMRIAWKVNDLKPRVYYARGPSQYYSSRVIQELFNLFVDAITPTHRKGRFSLWNLDDLTPEFFAMIYDYSSFTSTLDEIRRFTGELAKALKGFQITILDTYEGPTSIDAGELLEEFNERCNNFPMFDLSELLEVTECVLNHTCGMLGVPGNISSCTLLHGIHLAVIVGSLSRCRVVGDDAIGLFLKDEYTKESTIDAICNLGLVSEEKTVEWDGLDAVEDNLVEDLVWDYCKRPLNVASGKLIGGFLFVWPRIDSAFGISDPARTDNKDYGTIESKRLVLTQLSKLYETITNSPVTETETDSKLLAGFCGLIYSTNFEGFQGGFNRDLRTFSPMPNEEDYRATNAFIRMPSSATFRIRRIFPESFQTGIASTIVGSCFIIRPTRVVISLIRLGYLEEREFFEEISKEVLMYGIDPDSLEEFDVLSVLCRRSSYIFLFVALELQSWMSEYLLSTYPFVESTVLDLHNYE